MWTSSRTMALSVSSISSTTWVPSDIGDGQQANVTGRYASSLLFACHFKSGRGVFARNARCASRTSKMLFWCEALFKFGCTLYLKSWSCGASLRHTRSAFAVSRTVTRNSPWHVASLARPPSTSRSARTFSSISTFTGSSSGFTTAGAASSCVAAASLSPNAGAGSAGPKISPGFFLLSNMPFFGAPGLNVGPLSLSIAEDHGGEGVGSCMVMLGAGSEKLFPLKLSIAFPLELSSFACDTRNLASSICFFLAISRASLILLCSIIWWSFSSWLSISVYVFICESVTLSRCPKEITSSKAKTMSKALFNTCSSFT
mmetsp:Transcript_67481/g.188290  ORF Transcript_67481/g.188290 Transcript_67481/m.188290 type:complete len:315 (+) Transcript_67481:286-1230(+)